MNYVFETDGKTKGDAIKKAMELLGVGEDDATFVTEGGSLLGLVSRKPVTVKVKNDKKKLSDDALIRGVTLTIIARLGVDGVVQEVEETDENYVVHVESEESGFLIGRQGRTLDALQFLVNLLLNRELKKKKRVLVDVAHYRERRTQYLKKLARNIAGRVLRNGKSFLLEAMNPYERRIIHLELEGDAKITTESEGNGLYKRVRVMRVDEGASGNRGNRRASPAMESDDDDDYPNGNVL